MPDEQEPDSRWKLWTAVAAVAIVILWLYWPRTPDPLTADDIDWSYETVGADVVTGAPLTKVWVHVRGDKRDAGIYEGSCAELAETELLPNEIDATLCFFGGSGDEIGVFKDGGAIMVRHGDALAPNDETEAYRGNFTDLFAL